MYACAYTPGSRRTSSVNRRTVLLRALNTGPPMLLIECSIQDPSGQKKQCVNTNTFKLVLFRPCLTYGHSKSVANGNTHVCPPNLRPSPSPCSGKCVLPANAAHGKRGKFKAAWSQRTLVINLCFASRGWGTLSIQGCCIPNQSVIEMVLQDIIN